MPKPVYAGPIGGNLCVVDQLKLYHSSPTEGPTQTPTEATSLFISIQQLCEVPKGRWRECKYGTNMLAIINYGESTRLKEGDNRKLIVDCNNEGILFIEAVADVKLEHFGDEIEFLKAVKDMTRGANTPSLLPIWQRCRPIAFEQEPNNIVRVSFAVNVRTRHYNKLIPQDATEMHWHAQLHVRRL
ncbi:hypothetical protein Patl1_29420 [Pistacia atlantica]|uniref:Uncharacterized protein n=1 Tax=Pistacia atlantica TaxID=434234 RepID=A0ACC1ABB7_9ROSI|nr:hypothetical protein Patl1_29420 [Pistacia atlantica]